MQAGAHRLLPLEEPGHDQVHGDRVSRPYRCDRSHQEELQHRHPAFETERWSREPPAQQRRPKYEKDRRTGGVQQGRKDRPRHGRHQVRDQVRYENKSCILQAEGQQEAEAQPSGQIPVIYAWQSLVARDEEVEKREEHEIDDPDQNRTKRIPGLLRQPRFLNGAIVLCTRHKYRGPVTRPESPDSRSSGGV